MPDDAPSNPTDAGEGKNPPVAPEYAAVVPDETMENDLRQLVRLAIAEDLGRSVDWTTVCLIGEETCGQCSIVPRAPGVAAGMMLVPWILDEFDADIDHECHIKDGQPLVPGQKIVTLSGNARDLLTSERVVLNILCKLCGIATKTREFVQAIEGHYAKVYDTRKTTPGWRRLEKYAVRMGGGQNHRTGLFDGFLIKDNHLALGGGPGTPLDPADAVRKALQWRSGRINQLPAPDIVEIEVDRLDQLQAVLPAGPDIVLVDNFTLDQLRQAVVMRDQLNPSVQLEASGNVRIDTIGEIAATGVDRISSGALTHRAMWLDLGLDWLPPQAS
ncbi:carboxylating nicotinate-nucleotide diphosphorylase [Crateriforma spongiae]|uniref:carboxylating nicotinate-nucleotide diphosphorylase n=1 Tax=Crateriforma spongiae TaxID=2724528 RepID=UPI0039B049B7